MQESATPSPVAGEHEFHLSDAEPSMISSRELVAQRSALTSTHPRSGDWQASALSKALQLRFKSSPMLRFGLNDAGKVSTSSLSDPITETMIGN
jgi:hypothetical protein